ncbi:hypothetical protein [Bythopirellula polymerisocia]|uniref:Uncharacterized protein n=1 Tax=Bythopirellula polymerisocia TaxID=2528003 RepID=A0A5C6D2U1_9BACT|nr:hypothetical protein [Bythopirellula polymerisocia]TWU30174.1 hypothetical protein Pla144_09600 [Bythopirellula polymerisocia]
MFCSECGARAMGKFCSACGVKLSKTESTVEETVELPIDWSDVIDYETLLEIPEIRSRIARNASQSKKSLSGEDFLDMYGNALGKLAGLPIKLPMASLAHFAQSTYAKLGVKTGKARSQFVAQPTGIVLVTILCYLARTGRTLRGVHQLADGCVIVAALPSDMLALEGDLILTVGRSQGGTQVEAKTEIPGQMFDWGKSTRCLESLFSELVSAAA